MSVITVDNSVIPTTPPITYGQLARFLTVEEQGATLRLSSTDPIFDVMGSLLYSVFNGNQVVGDSIILTDYRPTRALFLTLLCKHLNDI